jgi:hypothetical protein
MFEPLKLVEIQAAALTSDSNMYATGIDLGPYVNVGKRQIMGVWAPAVTGTDTNETYDCKFRESDGVSGAITTADSDWADVTSGAFTQVTHTGSAFSQSFQSIRFLPTKRFLNILVTLGGTTATLQNYVAVVAQARFDT